MLPRLVRIAVEIIGWTGATALLLSYILVSSGRLHSRSAAYQLLNLLGAFGFIVNGWYHGAYPSMMLNVVWLGLALWFLFKRKAATQ